MNLIATTRDVLLDSLLDRHVMQCKSSPRSIFRVFRRDKKN